MFARLSTASLAVWSGSVARTSVSVVSRAPAARMSTYGADTPFILLARCHVKPEFAKEHLDAARVADAGVEASEPGMLHHTWDQDPDDPLVSVHDQAQAT